MRNSIFFVIAAAVFTALNPNASSAQTLYRQFSGTTARLNAIAFPTDSDGITVGDSAVLASTTDGGGSWGGELGFYADTTINFHAVFFNDQYHGLVAGDSGVILLLTNNIFNPRIQLPETKSIYSITFPTYDTAVVVGAQGLIYKSNDSGKTWYKINPPLLLANRNFYGVDYFDDSTYWLVGQKGIVLYTEDAGTTWQRIPVPTTKDLYSICFPDSTGAGWIVGDSTLLYTTDGGDDWTSVPTTASLRYVTGYDSLDAYAVGLNGVLLVTSDLAHWSPIPTGTTANLYGIDIPDSLYVCGDSGIILSTLPPQKPIVPDFSIDDVDFGSDTIGKLSMELDSIRNLSSSQSTITSITVDSSEFTLVDPLLPFLLSPNGHVEITIIFRPTYAGKVISAIRVTGTFNDSTIIRSATLSGLGVPAPQNDVASSVASSFKQLTIASNGRNAFLEIPADLDVPIHITLTNTLGEQVFSSNVPGSMKLDAGALPAGVYFYKISSEEKASMGKFILE